MSSRRTLKAASAIREVVSMAILTELRDPRIQNVTVTFVEISGDMRLAKIHVSIMGDERQQSLCLHGLRCSAGYLQKRVSDRIDTRYTPKLQFVLDRGLKNAQKVAQILDEVLPRELEAEVDEGLEDEFDDEADETIESWDELPSSPETEGSSDPSGRNSGD